MSDTRPALTYKVRVGNVQIYYNIGFYPNGDIGEVSIKCSKHGSALRGCLDSLGIVISMALQHGVSLSDIADNMIGLHYEPNGFTSCKMVRQVTSIPDHLFRWLKIRFPEQFPGDDTPAQQ
jgi:ribonucleoside-diphosphate reductase alpha chain